MKITVTQQGIDKGEPGSSDECPIALALRRSYPEAAIHLDICRIAIDDGRIITPHIAGAFIHDFDHGRSVAPFEFNLSCD